MDIRKQNATSLAGQGGAISIPSSHLIEQENNSIKTVATELAQTTNGPIEQEASEAILNSDALSQILNEMRAAGMDPPDIILPGRHHRFPGVNKFGCNMEGWCKLSEDGQSGIFGCLSSGLKETWHAKRDKPMSSSNSRRSEYLDSRKLVFRLVRNAFCGLGVSDEHS